MSPQRFRQFAWIVLGYAILVIVWGAVVRATSSGAGCGAHWPLCNGEVVPLAPTLTTIIEFAHRMTSGLILIMTVLLLWMAAKTFPAGHAARRAARWSLVFVIIEALVGAGIVLLRLVEDNASALRAVYIGGHLTNTLMLVGCYTWTIVAADSTAAPWTAETRTRWSGWLRLALIGLIIVSAVGAVVALGDTLFPHKTLAEGLAADLDPAAHFLIRLRVWHPVIAAIVSALLMTTIVRSGAMDEPALRTPARAVVWFVIIQVALGAANLFLLAPLALQMAHLLVSNLLWVATVWVWLLLRRG
ncbi:MAG: heme A synthase [Acidobacteria bacterium]|nr:MAG: heme A synthase [Acidobacteriota bacterium]